MLVRHLAVAVPIALLSLSLASGCEPDVKIGPASAPQTGRMQISKDGKTLYVALADHDLVRAVDAHSGAKLGEVAVPGYPHRLTVLDDGRVAVSARYAGTVSVVNVEKGTVDGTADVGSDPFGLVQVGHAVLVAVAGEGDLARIDLADPTRVASRITLHHGDPRGIVRLEDGRVAVTHFTAGYVSIIDGDNVAADVDMHLPSKQFFFPNQMGSITASADGDGVVVPHVECNNDPAQFLGGTNFAGQPSVTYYVDGPTGYPAVNPAVSRVDPASGSLLSDENRPLEEANGSAPEHAGDAAPVVDALNRNLLHDETFNGPQEIATVDGGKLQLVVARGSGNVIVRRPVIGEGEPSIVAVVPLKVGVESIQVSPDGTTAYVYNAFDDTISSFAVPADASAKSRYAGGSAGALKKISVDNTFTVAAPVLPADVREGRVLFYSVNDDLTKFGAISCDSCHPGGGPDGTTWHFAEGPRNAPALWGGILGTEPFHWDQSVPNMAGISDVTIVGRMGGNGLDATAMNKVGKFLDQIPAPMPPSGLDAQAVAHGEELFYGSAGCGQCHAGDAFTDNLTHSVGTGGDNLDWSSEFATPVLHGLIESAPYLHDGSAATLEDVVERLVATDKMGHGSNLSFQDKADLVAFLKTL